MFLTNIQINFICIYRVAQNVRSCIFITDICGCFRVLELLKQIDLKKSSSFVFELELLKFIKKKKFLR